MEKMDKYFFEDFQEYYKENFTSIDDMTRADVEIAGGGELYDMWKCFQSAALMYGNCVGFQGHDEPCYYCRKPCNSLAGAPSEWPIPLCHEDDPGKVKWHHIGCVMERLPPVNNER